MGVSEPRRGREVQGAEGSNSAQEGRGEGGAGWVGGWKGLGSGGWVIRESITR